MGKKRLLTLTDLYNYYSSGTSSYHFSASKENENIVDFNNVDFSKLYSLEYLTIDKCNNVKFNSIGNLELKTLNIYNCDFNN